MKTVRQMEGMLVSSHRTPGVQVQDGAGALGPVSRVESGLSPSLVGRQAGGGSPDAYEIKFALSEDLARAVEARFAGVLAADPHADPTLGGAYAVTSLYTDTPAFDVYYREGRFATRKYRVRRYGSAAEAFLERKTVRDRRVRKRRTAMGVEAIERAIRSQSGESEWFARQVDTRELRPICLVRYLRRAMFGLCPDGSAMRVTFDRSVRGAMASGWSFAPRTGERALLEGVVITEFKFAGVMPGPMKAVMTELTLTPHSMSKYRACARAFQEELGLPQERTPRA